MLLEQFLRFLIFRSTFNARKTPDDVLDDLAYRNLRKDDNLSNPEQLGIVKDPNAVISSHSCWKHKMERKLKEPTPKVNPFPQIDYPVRNPKLLKAVSSQIRTLVRKQSLNANANSNNEILTYEDLISNPEILAAMKSEFGIEEIELTNERQNWQGKTRMTPARIAWRFSSFIAIRPLQSVWRWPGTDRVFEFNRF